MKRVLGFARLEPILKLDNRWIAVWVGIVTFVCLSILGLVLSDRYEHDIHRGIERQLKSISQDAAQFIDGEAHKQMRLGAGMDDPKYSSENKKLMRVLHANEDIQFVYTCFLDGDQVKFGLDPTEPGDKDGDGREDKSYFGEVYDAVQPAIWQSLRTGRSVADEKPYQDEWGTFISAYSPVFDKAGNLEAIVGVDLSADKYLAELSNPLLLRQVWILGSLLVGLAGAFGTLYALNRVHKRFLTVLESKRVVEESYQELARLNLRLDWQSRTDYLTGLLNRQGFFSVVAKNLSERERGRKGNSWLVLMDIDNFKVANDHYGHIFGDHYLVAISERLTESFGGELLGRLGGDEFVLVLEEDSDEAEVLAQIGDFQRSLSISPFVVGLVSLHCSVSVGIVQAQPGEDPTELIRRADIAMYEAKRLGKGGLKVYEPWMGTELEARVKLERELRQGWNSGEFWMAIQPIVDLKTGRTNAGELLMRWTREDGSTVSPMDFIPVAEDTGLIVEMGYWAIEEACRNVERLEREFPDERIHLSVNVSPDQLNQVDFVDRVEEIYQKYSFHRGGLWLELTESSLLVDKADAAAKMNQIQEMGILLALDDFGTGYSSLSMLLDVPLDCLKIDRSFVMKLGEADNNEELVRMILRLSEMLGLYVVAEGIETPEHSDLLSSLGCRWGQGYLYSKPIPMSEFVDQLSGSKKAA